MVNAGAIIICSLLKSMVRPEMSLAEKFDYTHTYFKVSYCIMHLISKICASSTLRLWDIVTTFGLSTTTI